MDMPSFQCKSYASHDTVPKFDVALRGKKELVVTVIWEYCCD